MFLCLHFSIACHDCKKVFLKSLLMWAALQRVRISRSSRNHPVDPAIVCISGGQCPLPPRANTNTPHPRQCCVSLTLPWLHNCRVSLLLRACGITRFTHTHLCCTNIPQADVRGGDGEGCRGNRDIGSSSNS